MYERELTTFADRGHKDSCTVSPFRSTAHVILPLLRFLLIIDSYILYVHAQNNLVKRRELLLLTVLLIRKLIRFL